MIHVPWRKVMSLLTNMLYDISSILIEHLLFYGMARSTFILHEKHFMAFFPTTVCPNGDKTFGFCWNRTQVLLISKQTFNSLHHGFSIRTIGLSDEPVRDQKRFEEEEPSSIRGLVEYSATNGAATFGRSQMRCFVSLKCN